MATRHFNLFTILAVLAFYLQVTLTQKQTPKLILVQELFRHGARYPIYQLSNDNSHFAIHQKSSGELTKQGKAMHYYLGLRLYETYWKRLFDGTPFLNNYNQSKFYIKSTNVNRTIESAQSQLFGIFEALPQLQLNQQDLDYSRPQWPSTFATKGPVFGFGGSNYHPTVIHTEKGYMNPYENGDFLRTYSPEFCAMQNKWQQTNKNDKRVKEIINDTRYLQAVSAVSKAVKKDVDFFDLYKYIDNAICMTYLNQPGALEIFTKPSEIKKSLDSIYTLDLIIKLFYAPEQRAAVSTGFFNATINNFKKIIENSAAEQWIMYSAHDTTVMNFLVAMNMTNAECVYQAFQQNITKNTDTCVIQYPLFTSNIIFELYQYKNLTNTFKIRYNGVERKIPFCEYSLECNVDVLYRWYDSWKDVNYPVTCGVRNSQAQTFFSFAVVEFGIILVALICVSINYLKNRKEIDKIVKKPKKQELLSEEIDQEPQNGLEPENRVSLLTELEKQEK